MYADTVCACVQFFFFFFFFNMFIAIFHLRVYNLLIYNIY